MSYYDIANNDSLLFYLSSCNRAKYLVQITVEKVLNGILKKLLDPLSIWLCSKFEGNLRKDLPFQNDFICPLDHKLQ